MRVKGSIPRKKNCLAFSSFFSLLCEKHWKSIFQQHLMCAAPKHWSKYTTIEIKNKTALSIMIRLEYFSTFQNETAQVFSTFFKNMWNSEGNREVCLGLKLQQQTKVEKPDFMMSIWIIKKMQKSLWSKASKWLYHPQNSEIFSFSKNVNLKN